MKCYMEEENKVIRIIIDFMEFEQPKVLDIVSIILCDYKRSFETIQFRKDPMKEGRAKFTEFYIRASDKKRAERLLKVES